MPSPSLSLKPVRELAALAQKGPGGRLADEVHLSLPIPLASAGPAPRVAFLFLPSRLVFGTGLVLSTPTHRAVLDASKGEVLSFETVAPVDLGVADTPGKELGTFGLPAGMSSEEYLRQRETLLDALDDLLGPWFAGVAAKEAGHGIRAAAGRLLRGIASVGEPPLAPYYRAVGRAFFAWLDELAAAA